MSDVPDDETATEPTDLPDPADPARLSLFAVVRRAVTEFGRIQATDLAAALTYYAVLAIFPGLLAVVALFGVVGEAETSVQTLVDILTPVAGADVTEQLRPVLVGLASVPAAGVTLVISILAALWSASGYVGAFSRAVNRIYGVREGRPVWKLRPMQFLVTLVAVVFTVAGLTMIIVSGPVTRSIGAKIGLPETTVRVWEIAKVPVLLLLVVLLVAILYWATPNVRQPRFRWLSAGAVVAILIWIVASAGFAFYVANFSSYNRTYGSLAGVIVALLWLWLSNLALLFGATLDVELERRRELHAGVAAEERLQLDVRDARGIGKADQRQAALVARARAVREAWSEPRDE